MKLGLGEYMAGVYLDTHGVTGWRFVWDDTIDQDGYCDYDTQTIAVSRRLAEANSDGWFRDVVLHEIAHALTPGAGHGQRWRETAIRIGSTGAVTGDDLLGYTYVYD